MSCAQGIAGYVSTPAKADTGVSPATADVDDDALQLQPTADAGGKGEGEAFCAAAGTATPLEINGRDPLRD